MNLLWEYQKTMTWVDQKNAFEKRFDELNEKENEVETLISDLNTNMASFIKRAGLSQDPQDNPQYKGITENLDRLNAIKLEYKALHDDITNFVTDQSAPGSSLNTLLADNGTLQNQINKLEKIQEEMKVDVVSAQARDELLRTRNTNVTRHDLFLFRQPVSRNVVPYLWVFSVLFIAFGIFIFRIAFPMDYMTASYNASYSYGFIQTLYDYFSNNMILMSILISGLIVIVFLSLRVAGVLK
jgi:hypothetical protein